MLQNLKTKTCPQCNGTGIDDFDAAISCYICLGEGIVDLHTYNVAMADLGYSSQFEDQPTFVKIKRRQRQQYV